MRLSIQAAISLVLGVLLSPARSQDTEGPPRLEKLSRLATYLDTQVPSDRFDIRRWGNYDTTDPRFKGCVGGYAVKLFHDENVDELYMSPKVVRYNTRIDGKRKMWTGVQAMQHYFRISWEDAEDIFTPKGYRYLENMTDPHYAARKIKDLIKRELKEHPEYAKVPARKPTRYPSRVAKR